MTAGGCQRQMEEPRLRKRNYGALLTEGSLFFTGMSFIDVNAVIPVFIYAYTGSVRLAGLAATISAAASILVQLMVGPHIRRLRNLPAYITLVMFLIRPLPFVMIPVLLLDLPPPLAVGVFFLVYTLLCGGDGLILVPWAELFSRTVVPGRRGLLLGSQQLFGGIGALAAGTIVKTLLDHPRLADGQRFAVLFGAAGAVLTLSALVMSFARDLPHPPQLAQQSPRQYYRSLPRLLGRDRLFCKVVTIRSLSLVSLMLSPFIVLFGQERLGFAPQQVSTLVYLQIIGSLLGGWLWGQISNRLGNQQVILLSQSLALLLAGSALLLSLGVLPGVPVWLFAPLTLINGVNMAAWLGYMNYTIDIAAEAYRTHYLLISNLVTLPFTFLTLASGLVIQAAGYRPVFAVSLAAAVLAVVLARRLPPPQGPVESQAAVMLPPKQV